jgi:hypothetical protein
MYIGIVLCVLIVFSLRRELLKLILVANLSPRAFRHIVHLLRLMCKQKIIA